MGQLALLGEADDTLWNHQSFYDLQVSQVCQISCDKNFKISSMTRLLNIL